MKKIISLAVVATMLFALVACNGNGLSRQVKELEASVEEQTKKITMLEAAVNLQDETINGLQDKLNGVLEDEWAFVMSDLKAAYDAGKITREDLMHVAYYTNSSHRVFEGNVNGQFDSLILIEDQITQIYFVPEVDERVELTAGIQLSIKEEFLRSEKMVAKYPNLTIDKVRLSNSFIFNGNVITKINYPTGLESWYISCISIGGIVFIYDIFFDVYCFSLV